MVSQNKIKSIAKGGLNFGNFSNRVLLRYNTFEGVFKH